MPFSAQNLSISTISLRPPVLEVVILAIVKPSVKTCPATGGPPKRWSAGGRRLLAWACERRIGARRRGGSPGAAHVGGDGRAHADEAHGAALAEEREELGEVDGLLRREGHLQRMVVGGGRWEVALEVAVEVAVEGAEGAGGGGSRDGGDEEAGGGGGGERPTRMTSSVPASASSCAWSECAAYACAPISRALRRRKGGGP